MEWHWGNGIRDCDMILCMMPSSNGNIFRYWPCVRGIHRSPVNFPHEGQWRGALMFSLICARINGWVNNREASDLRRHCAHYDVIVMCKLTTDWTYDHCNYVTLKLCSLRLPAIRLFVPQLMRTLIKATLKYTLLARFQGNSPVTGEFPTQRSSNAE